MAFVLGNALRGALAATFLMTSVMIGAGCRGAPQDGADMSPPPDLQVSCSDHLRNGDETDVDCGGSCLPCPVGKACLTGADCGQKVCDGRVCAAPTCMDGVKNADETDTDCGGSCKPCAFGKACKANADCQQGVCDTSACRPPVSCNELHAANASLQSGAYTIRPDASGKAAPITAQCDMSTDGGGWTLVYNRNNAYFTPDHMYHKLPATAGPTSADNSTSWFIPPDAARWKWLVSVDSGATFKGITTSVPAQAGRTAPSTAQDVLVTVYDNTLGTSGDHYYQSFTFADRSSFGYGTTWFGLLNIKQGHADDPQDPGIGGNYDSCTLNAHLVSGDGFTWPDGSLELYWGGAKDVQGPGGGGTACQPSTPTSAYRMRIWIK